MEAQEFNEQCIGIAGVGLIGGSIGAALKSGGFPGRIVGLGRNANRLAAARGAGLIDEFATDAAQLASKPTLWIFCTPVDRIVDGIRQAAGTADSGTVFTDAGSTKQQICEGLSTGLPVGVEFVGSHPLAGSEKGGFENAAADLFRDRVCVVTRSESNAEASIDRVEALWRAIGMTIVRTSPFEHDRLLATTSHLPHVAASALASLVNDAHRPFVATGFKDTTRVAGGDPELWTAILSRNNGHVAEALTALQAQLENFRKAIAANDEAAIRRLLADGHAGRRLVDQ